MIPKPTVILFLLMFTACGLLGSGDGGNPDIPGKIVFAADDDKTSQIYTMNADGSEVKKLTDFGKDNGGVQPSWSHDGKQIVFSTTLRSSSNGLSLYIMDADGSDMRPMNEREGSDIPTPGNHARWSPDGSKIAFDRCVNCQVSTNHMIFSYEFEIDSVTQLTDFKRGVSNTNPTWSPDGSRIAFVSNRDYVDADTMRFRQDLYLISTDWTNLKRITNTGFARTPIWNPNGNAITFRSSDPETDLGLFQFDLQTKQISIIENNLSANNQLFPQAWSADGSLLLATGRDLSRPQEYFIYIIDTVKKETKQLPFGPTEISGADWFVPKEN